MAFTEDLTAFFNDFAVDATLNGSAVSVIFDAVYQDQFNVESFGPVATILTSQAASVAHGQSLVIGTTTYTVRGIEPDGTGITLLRLERA